MNARPHKIVYCTPALYMAGGVERVLSLEASYMADHYGYDVTIILTEGKDKPLFYGLSPRVKVINLDIGFEELWTCGFLRKVWVYLKKQRRYKRLLTRELLRLRPDMTVSLLRREINFITGINDGSRKVGWLHVNRAHYRNFEGADANILKNLFARFWMHRLVGKLQRLSRLVVLTESDRTAWRELDNVVSIPNPLPFWPAQASPLQEHRVVVVGRYCHEKGYDLLLQAWRQVEQACSDWRLDVYGDGDSTPYERLIDELHIDRSRCQLHGRTADVEQEYLSSSLCVCSSRFEGFGMVIVEAMACGLPVVSFDCPWGPRSIITSGEDGLLVEDGNVGALAQALIGLTVDNAGLQQMGRLARVNVQRFGIDAIAARWKEEFDKLT